MSENKQQHRTVLTKSTIELNIEGASGVKLVVDRENFEKLINYMIELAQNEGLERFGINIISTPRQNKQTGETFISSKISVKEHVVRERKETTFAPKLPNKAAELKDKVNKFRGLTQKP